MQMKSYQVVDFGHTLRDTAMLDPKPTGDEVVIAVKATGGCHSDLHIWEGGFDLGGGRKLTLKDRGVDARARNSRRDPINWPERD
jgi:NADPH:quinone reductase-like Zn-dependent oxidoreductase